MLAPEEQMRKSGVVCAVPAATVSLPLGAATEKID